MKILFSLAVFWICILNTVAGTIEKTYYFNQYSIQNSGIYTTISFENTQLAGKPGEPLIPYHAVSLLLPPGETAQSIDITGENETEIPGTYILFPKQYDLPISSSPSSDFIINKKIYRSENNYPVKLSGKITTQVLNGYSFALSTFTPLRYNPASGKVSYYKTIVVRITTAPSDSKLESLENFKGTSDLSLNRVTAFAQNPEMTSAYPDFSSKQKSSYNMLIITPEVFQNDYFNLINYYSTVGMDVRVVTTESIYSQVAGIDNQDKIRNKIKQEYQNNGIDYVLLGGGAQYVPFRGFYCYVQSGSGYEDSNIPADLYYSGLDGTYDANGNQIYGEVADQPDFLPEISVGRFPFSTSLELASMIHKTVSYQSDPVLGELKKNLMVGEFLTASPSPTWGGNYLDLMINDHSDYGYFTHGIPENVNTIEKLYDTPYSSWDKQTLITKLNQGQPFVHHLGHSSTDYMMRMDYDDITNETFSQLNGSSHNYPILYTQGCYAGAFDEQNCIAVKSLAIDNFLVAGIFNSRYGWFNQGMNDGPSQHLQREFVSAVYTDTLPEKHLGTAHLISKINTAPWVTDPEEFEPGAQRWCHYSSNVLGDPALMIWTDEPEVIVNDLINFVSLSIFPNPASSHITVTYCLRAPTEVGIAITNLYGQPVTNPYIIRDQKRGNQSFSIQLPELSPGIYFITLKTSYSAATGKLTIVK